jgi:hypothetical protein
MPPKIYSVKEPLDLKRLHLAKPTNKNGSHFIKTLDVDNPIYFLGPKCFSKNGFVKSGKKIFCDFVFSNEDSDFLAWLENLEESSRKCIYENRETWFETPLDEHDIESSMTSPYKPYKSGKYFIVRANVPTVLDKINIKIYDEHEKETDPENIKENTKVLAVLEFQGIRCSVRSFQFEIELKQLLIVEPEKLFEKCIIGTSYKTVDTPYHPLVNHSPTQEHNTKNETVANEHKEVDSLNIELSAANTDSVSFDDKSEEEIVESEQQNSEEVSANPVQIPVEVFDLPAADLNISQIEIISDELLLDNATDSNSKKEPPLKLKSRNDVYYKLYKEMRQRAKEAKREALANYLEAKRIKNTYLLEDVSDSESDDEAHISI